MGDHLRTYDSFHDPHLQTYFGNKNVRKHLRKVGLINRHGEVIPYKEYEATINQRSKQEHLRALLSHGIVQRVIQLEKTRQANIRNQFEIEAKKLLVENIKESRQQSKEFRSKDLIKLNRPKTTNINQEQLKILDEHPSRLSSVQSSRLSTRLIRNKSPKIIKSNVNNDSCQIKMIYLGGQTYFDSKSVEIVIMQQHCGGQNLIIFKDFLKPNEEFQFESRRHFEYPFALTLYINGLIDCRISVCCEYKHKLGSPLGGKKASFAFLNVQGGKPCQTCRFNEFTSNYSLYKTKSSQQTSVISDQSSSHRLLRTPSPYSFNESHDDEYDQAEQIYKTILKKLDENLNFEEIGYLHYQLGNICKEGFGDYEKALEHYLLSLENLCQNFSSLNLKLRNIYLSIAHILLLQGRNQNQLTIKYFQRILLIDNSFKNSNENNLINDHNYLALLYQNQQNYSKALFHFDKSLQYYLLINSNTNLNLNEQSNSFLLNETIYDEKAFKSLSIDKLPNLSEIYFSLSTIYQTLGEKQNALKHAQKAFQLSNQNQIYRNYLNKLQQN